MAAQSNYSRLAALTMAGKTPLEMLRMSHNWKQWEGQTIDARFPLHQYLGASEHDAVFLTERAGATPSRAAIKIVPEEFTEPDQQLSSWQKAAQLSHPNLLRLYECGRTQVNETAVLYVVMEYAEEDLSQILPDRPLSPTECGAMLQPILEALSYVHKSGMVHGQMRPANVVAVGNTVKLTSDTVQSAGPLLVKDPEFPTPYDAPEVARTGVSARSDVWALGATMLEALTQDPPAFDSSHPQDPLISALPEPFAEVVRNCLRIDPASRWPLERIQSALSRSVETKLPNIASAEESILPPPPSTASQPVAPATAGSSGRPRWHTGLGIVLGAVLVALIVYLATRSHNASAQPDSVPVSAPAASPVPTETARSSESSAPSASSPAKLASSGDVVHRDIPTVSPSALHTIHGTIRVSVRVSVDPEGNVTATAFETHGPSAYFAKVARESAREWKFAAPQVDGKPAPSDWLLKYQFRRDGTSVTPALENP